LKSPQKALKHKVKSKKGNGTQQRKIMCDSAAPPGILRKTGKTHGSKIGRFAEIVGKKLHGESPRCHDRP